MNSENELRKRGFIKPQRGLACRADMQSPESLFWRPACLWLDKFFVEDLFRSRMQKGLTNG